MASNENLQSPISLFYHWEKTAPDNIFLRQPYGKTWKTLTYKEAGQEIRKMSIALKDLGLQKGEHAGIYSKNCYHWILADLACMMCGFVSVPFFASLPKNQLQELIEKSDLKAIFLGKLDSWGDRLGAIPSGVKIIRFPHYEGNATISGGYEWNELIKNTSPLTENNVPDLNDLWTILFTSGTTGTPKGVMHTYKSVAVIFQQEDKYGSLGIGKLKEHRFFSFLPLNHVGERIGVEMNCLKMGGSISFGESINTFVKNLQDTQPTFFFAVPRIWHKFQTGVFGKISEKKLNLLLNTPVISGIIKKNLRKALGFKDLEITLTGAAITPEKLKDWYRKIGINLREVYGMTEACGSITLSPIGDTSKKNVGKPMPGTEVKIDPVTSEIIYRSPQQMIGYYKEPEKTKEVLRNGWIHSGDKGIIDEQGYLRIVGRLKDAFKTAKGVFVTPNSLEEEFSKSNLVEQVCVAGLGLPQPIALINKSELAKRLTKEEVKEHLKNELARINKKLSEHEKISTIIICKDVWSESNEMLTPTLKARRIKIDDYYGDNYLTWHEHSEIVIWEQ